MNVWHGVVEGVEVIVEQWADGSVWVKTRGDDVHGRWSPPIQLKEAK